MRYQVRTQEGELTFQSFGEVEQAWLMGLVGPDDELLEEGKTLWRKASSFPLLVQARRTGEQAWGGSWFLWAVIGILAGSGALWLIHEGIKELQASGNPSQLIAGGLLALATASLMFHVVTKAHQRSRPHGVVTSSRLPSPSPDRQRPPS
jgi:hypothetical protein